MGDSTAAPAQTPATLEDLKLLKTRLGTLFAATFVASLILCYAFVLLLPKSPTGDMVTVNRAVALLCMIAPGVVVAWGARKMGIPGWWLILPISVWPAANWIALALVEGYIPPHLRPEQPREHRSRWVWLITGLTPLGCMAVMAVTSPTYMASLYGLSPAGTTFTSSNIPCGWPILVTILGLTALADYSLWLGRARWRVHPRVMTVAWVLIILLLVVPAVGLTVFGPAIPNLIGVPLPGN